MEINKSMCELRVRVMVVQQGLVHRGGLVPNVCIPCHQVWPLVEGLAQDQRSDIWTTINSLSHPNHIWTCLSPPTCINQGAGGEQSEKRQSKDSPHHHAERSSCHSYKGWGTQYLLFQSTCSSSFVSSVCRTVVTIFLAGTKLSKQTVHRN